MMSRVTLGICCSALLLAACAGPPVVADSRGPFDTANGLYGGNEFRPLSPEGQRVFKGEAPPAAPAAPTPAVALAAPPSAAVRQSGIAAGGSQPVHIGIDANAYAAVFGTAPGPVKPTPAQLMQLDSLSLMAADALRADLQKKILECRRAGENCLLGAP